jgi:hypothetical protein
LIEIGGFTGGVSVERLLVNLTSGFSESFFCVNVSNNGITAAKLVFEGRSRAALFPEEPSLQDPNK